MSRIAIMVGRHGRGSNMMALIRACAEGRVQAKVECVLTPSLTTPAVEFAEREGVQVVAFDPKAPDVGETLSSLLSERKIDVLCLAGYMNLLPESAIDTMRGRVLNIHPALLPKFGGKGMYGHHVHEAVLAAGETESGCTVHWVTREYDEGAIVLQKTCAVLPDDTAETLGERVLRLEHQAYAEAVQLVLSGGVTP